MRHSSRTSATPCRLTSRGVPSKRASTSACRGSLMRPTERSACPLLFVTRHEQRPGLRDPRPGRDLDDGADRASAGARTHLAQALLQPRAELGPRRADELELAPGLLRQLDEL